VVFSVADKINMSMHKFRRSVDDLVNVLQSSVDDLVNVLQSSVEAALEEN